mgnify:CR=1 FL=1
MTQPAFYDLCNYDDFLYDDVPTAGLRWFLEIDWNDDGVFDGSNDGFMLADLRTRRGRQNLLRSDNTGLEEVVTGEFEAELDNSDGRYDPYNITSPLYPYIQPGVIFQLRVLDLATGIEHDIMTGNITRIQPYRTGDGLERVKLRGEDGSTTLKDADVDAGVQSSYRTDQAIAAILTAAGWTGGSNLDTFTDTMSYWWGRGNSAWREIHDLVDASLGQFFIAKGGAATFYSRLHSRASMQTLTESDILAEYGITVMMPWEVMRNDIRMTVNTRTAQSASELWRLSDTPLVRAGESMDLWIDYRYNNDTIPATGVITPVATTDYTMNSLANGSGTNLTGNFTVTATKFAETAKLTIANGGGTDGYITLLKVRGQALTTTPVTLVKAASSGRMRRFMVDNPWLQSVNITQDILTVLYYYLLSGQVYPRVQLLDNPALQFTPDLFSLQSLAFPSKSISGDYATALIEHQWIDALGQKIRTTFYFEPRLGTSFWVFPALLGISTRFAG